MNRGWWSRTENDYPHECAVFEVKNPSSDQSFIPAVELVCELCELALMNCVGFGLQACPGSIGEDPAFPVQHNPDGTAGRLRCPPCPDHPSTVWCCLWRFAGSVNTARCNEELGYTGSLPCGSPFHSKWCYMTVGCVLFCPGDFCSQCGSGFYRAYSRCRSCGFTEGDKSVSSCQLDSHCVPFSRPWVFFRARRS